MARIGDLYPSKYFKESDLNVPLLLTIKEVTIEEVGRGGEKDTRPIIHFEESQKLLTVNKTNARRLEKIAKSDDTDNWGGKRIVVFWDQDVEFGGEITGGVRIRAPKSEAEANLPF
jgi:hypothetical protein